jgi:predicted dehydrogenase
MTSATDRRSFLAASAAALAGPTLLRAADSPSTRITVGVMGLGGRGTALARVFAGQPNVSVAYVADPDSQRAGKAAEAVAAGGAKAPQPVADFRRILDDKNVDVLVCATCNHWHAPATILACAAGKHVYVEKPCSHNPREGELMVEAARKYDRRVQMGNQRRSWPGVVEAIGRLREGAIGRVYLARAWYTNSRPTVGKGEAVPPPAGLDYDLWQGPAPRRPFRSNYLHYTWHWFWHWGNGELGNNGIHTIDVCRWGLNVGLPVRVTSAGGRYRFADDQETPDTQTVSYEFADRSMIVWEGLSCGRYPGGAPADVLFQGEKGTLAIKGGSYTIYDEKGKEVAKGSGSGGVDAHHTPNFLAAVRGEAKLNSEIAEGHTSTMLCHLGNMSQRTGRALTCDPASGRVRDDKAAMALWAREYEKGWEPKV